MTSAYATIIRENLKKIFALDLDQRAAALPARRDGDSLHFEAFGQSCLLNPQAVYLNGINEGGPRGIIVTLYALHVTMEEMVHRPYRSFKELPDSMPYVGAFANRSEQELCRIVGTLPESLPTIMAGLNGSAASADIGGDWAFVVHPLPKIALCYVCYAADEDFPPAVTCLFSNNAARFMPTDGLADVAEYTTKTIIALTQAHV